MTVQENYLKLRKQAETQAFQEFDDRYVSSRSPAASYRDVIGLVQTPSGTSGPLTVGQGLDTGMLFRNHYADINRDGKINGATELNVLDEYSRNDLLQAAMVMNRVNALIADPSQLTASPTRIAPEEVLKQRRALDQGNAFDHELRQYIVNGSTNSYDAFAKTGNARLEQAAQLAQQNEEQRKTEEAAQSKAAVAEQLNTTLARLEQQMETDRKAGKNIDRIAEQAVGLRITIANLQSAPNEQQAAQLAQQNEAQHKAEEAAQSKAAAAEQLNTMLARLEQQMETDRKAGKNIDRIAEQAVGLRITIANLQSAEAPAAAQEERVAAKTEAPKPAAATEQGSTLSLKDLAVAALPGFAALTTTSPAGAMLNPIALPAAVVASRALRSDVQAPAELAGPPALSPENELAGPPALIPAHELAGPPAPGKAPAVAPKAATPVDSELAGLPAADQQRIAALGTQVEGGKHTVKSGDSLDKLIHSNYPELGRDGISYLAVRLAIEAKNPDNKNIFLQDRFELRADAGEIKLPNMDEVKSAFLANGKTYAAAQQDICEALNCAPTQVASKATAESKGISFA